MTLLFGFQESVILGEPKGNYFNGEKMFDCKTGYGRIVEADALLPEENYYPAKENVKDVLEYVGINDGM